MGIAAALRHRRVLRGVASASGGADGRAQRDEPALRPPEQRGVRHGVVYLFVRRKAQHLQRQRERAAEQSRQEEVEMGSLRRGDGDAAVATGRVLTQHLLVVAAEPERALRKQRHGVVRENYEPSSPVPFPPTSSCHPSLWQSSLSRGWHGDGRRVPSVVSRHATVIHDALASRWRSQPTSASSGVPQWEQRLNRMREEEVASQALLHDITDDLRQPLRPCTGSGGLYRVAASHTDASLAPIWGRIRGSREASGRPPRRRRPQSSEQPQRQMSDAARVRHDVEPMRVQRGRRGRADVDEVAYCSPRRSTIERHAVAPKHTKRAPTRSVLILVSI